MRACAEKKMREGKKEGKKRSPQRSSSSSGLFFGLCHDAGKVRETAVCRKKEAKNRRKMTDKREKGMLFQTSRLFPLFGVMMHDLCYEFFQWHPHKSTGRGREKRRLCHSGIQTLSSGIILHEFIRLVFSAWKSATKERREREREKRRKIRKVVSYRHQPSFLWDHNTRFVECMKVEVVRNASTQQQRDRLASRQKKRGGKVDNGRGRAATKKMKRRKKRGRWWGGAERGRRGRDGRWRWWRRWWWWWW